MKPKAKIKDDIYTIKSKIYKMINLINLLSSIYMYLVMEIVTF